ncbi:hypothetical protein VOLCADRAFT_61118 [Volvox carteri f. nagariensis]|uniref:Ammonium transporter n=1 Tax=Volvox carteri f. nagariensis TaxID=3068 RepID=D8TXT5_VOLCA|nr:uncharacterized protein VOLCADRAFT_61118 [Volvox carteri f. nagariensis]EFJ47696.1 hypothetical protein VOLCADRAFT_61118 [Volvox carteri f. nagariensis]|eukprot:XP_002951167.1 hypothetical protein VOLCADRAFT_61118 [Volvox carteri f. nagariensis]
MHTLSLTQALCSQFASSSKLQDAIIGLNTLYLLLCGALVFVMHAGFAMLCAGAIRSKNTMNILLQTVMDAAVSAIAFYVLGYGFAYGVGDKPNGFIGDALYGLSRWRSHNYDLATGMGGDTGLGWQSWFFQWAFAATATTIPAGAVAERLNFNAYLVYSAFISAFVYPVVVHWVWSTEGWLGYVRRAPYGRLFGSGMIDFAGSGVVHMTGGLAGLAGCVLLGPRMGRFDSSGRPVEMPGHSASLVVLGTVLLWFGWYGFNPGSQLLINSLANAAVVGRAAVTTTLSGAAGCLTCLGVAFTRHKAWDLVAGCNGALVGFVTVTAGAHVLEPWAALIAGSTGALVFEMGCALLLKLKVDDPLAAAPMHAAGGAWGVVFVGLLAKKQYICESYGKDCTEPGSGVVPHGLFYGGGGRLLASQVIGVISIFAWVYGLLTLLFAVLNAINLLRISAQEEQAGLDLSKHGGSAYYYDHGLGKPEKAPTAAESVLTPSPPSTSI